MAINVNTGQPITQQVIADKAEQQNVQKQQVAQQDGLAEAAVQIGQPSFRVAGIAQLPRQCIPVLVELHEAHLEERQAQDLVLARRIAQYVLRQ